MRKPQMLILAAACTAALAGCSGDNWFAKRGNESTTTASTRSSATTAQQPGNVADSRSGSARNSASADARSGTAVNSAVPGSTLTDGAPATMGSPNAKSAAAAPTITGTQGSMAADARSGTAVNSAVPGSTLTDGAPATMGSPNAKSAAAAPTITGTQGSMPPTSIAADTGKAGYSSSANAAGATKGANGSTMAMGSNSATMGKGTNGSTTSANGSGLASKSTLGASDKQFFANAAQTDLLEIEASKLAADRATNPELKSFATMIVSDHNGTSSELKTLASSKGVTLPSELTGKSKATLDKLQKAQGAEFDRLYAQNVAVAAHKDAVDLFAKTAKSAKDPEVKSFAEKTLPALKQHLAQAQQIKMGSTSRTGGAASTDKSKASGGMGMTPGSTGTAPSTTDSPATTSTSGSTGTTRAPAVDPKK